MRLLGIDLGSVRVGWSYFETESGKTPTLISVGFWNLQPRRTSSEGVKWLRFRAALDGVLEVSRLRIDLVAYEEVRHHKGVSAAHAYGGSKAVLLAWCEGNEIEYTSVPISAVKRMATGKGGGAGTGKTEVLEAAQKRWPQHIFEHDDVSDSAFVGLACIDELGLGNVGNPLPLFQENP